MPVLISDETLRAAGMNEREAKLEIACRWFDAGKLSLGHAAQLAGIGRDEFEGELDRRAIPRHRYTDEMLDNDVAALKKLGRW
jgi:predicted HTH domain antitoxin